MRIGPHALRNNLLVAPMAGVTDRAFRRVCRGFGAGLAVSEMVTSQRGLWHSAKTRRRLDHEGEPAPVAVQIAGADPGMMAEAARFNAGRGAGIIDINMGCPAKKVCNAAAGSALLRDEALVGRILEAVVGAVDVPVTLKFRTGWDPQTRNAVRIARIAENAGIRMLTLHGRTRACGFSGHAEYDSIREVKRSTRLPVVANGDIRTPEQARRVLDYTGADGIMIGRAAHGRPWIFREVAHFLATGSRLPAPSVREAHATLVHHLHELYSLHGAGAGVRIARKHVHWYTSGLKGAAAFRAELNCQATCADQLAAVDRYFEGLAQDGERLHRVEEPQEW
ncbi:MAG: tRNA dihydrouridine synthase DusB [Burkholderiales bacterium]|nr:tRNA dihydrouridine synthase DusB [Burkholderiales bacterium]